MCSLLCSYGAQPWKNSGMNQDGKDALDLALNNQTFKVLAAVKPANHMQELFIACKSANADRLARWLNTYAEEADLNSTDRRERTALHYLVRKEESRDKTKCLQLLLKAGALLTCEDMYGDTALHLAAKSCDIQAVASVLQYWPTDLSVDPVNKSLNTPFEVTKSSGVQQLLLQRRWQQAKEAVARDTLVERLRNRNVNLMSRFPTSLKKETLRAESKPRYSFFLSHYQHNGSAKMGRLALELETRVGLPAWYDQNMGKEVTEQGIKRGIAESAVFLLFLTRGMFMRRWCRFEIREALRLGKPMILLHETVEAPDDSGANIAELRQEAPKDLKKLFDHLVAVKHRGDSDERDVMLAKLCKPGRAVVVPH